jgi:hypothetical protein
MVENEERIPSTSHEDDYIGRCGGVKERSVSRRNRFPSRKKRLDETRKILKNQTKE